MGAIRIGSLCSGYGGLDRAVENFYDAETAWFSEFDAAPSKILAYRWPGVPNLGDMTKIDWASTPDVDIIVGGTPCQDLSGAGKRAGMTDGTRSNLWVQMREAIAVKRPALVVWENVRGAYSANASCGLESCEGCVGDSGVGGPFLRALGRVLGDLSELGYDTEWVGLRASDAGAPHARFRVFVVAYDRSAANSGRLRGRPWGHAAPGEEEGRRAFADLGGSGRTHPADVVALFPTTGVADATGGHASRSGARSDEPLLPGLVRLFPTPNASQTGYEQDLDGFERRRAVAADKWGNNGLGLPLGVAVRQLPEVLASAPTKLDAVGEYEALWNSLEDQSPYWVTDKGDDYWPAISRWAEVMSRKSPSPTLPDGKGGKHRLNAKFTEWLMGQPAGWITSPEIGLTRNEQLKAGGNGVVTQQCELALSIAWPRVLEQLGRTA